MRRLCGVSGALFLALIAAQAKAAAGEEASRGLEAMKEALERAAKQAELQAELRTLEMRRQLMRKVTFNFDGTSLKKVLDHIRKQTKVNIIVANEIYEASQAMPMEFPIDRGPPEGEMDAPPPPLAQSSGVSYKVNIKLKNVTLKQALRAIARQQGLHVSFEEGIVFLTNRPSEGQVGELTIKEGPFTLNLKLNRGDLDEWHRLAFIRQALKRASAQSARGKGGVSVAGGTR